MSCRLGQVVLLRSSIGVLLTAGDHGNCIQVWRTTHNKLRYGDSPFHSEAVWGSVSYIGQVERDSDGHVRLGYDRRHPSCRTQPNLVTSSASVIIPC